jgi:hypothetical protein
MILASSLPAYVGGLWLLSGCWRFLPDHACLPMTVCQ